MKIPFFSKKTKKVLKDNEERIFLKTKEDQEKILKDPTIKPEQKLEQVLKENNELKVLFDSLNDQLSKDIKSGGTYVFSVGHGEVELITNPKILTNNKIKIGKRTIDIKEGSWVGKIKSFSKTKQFRCYFVESEGEYTYDPRDETPIEIKKKNEMQLSLGHTVQESGIVESIVQGLGSKVKSWIEYIPYIAIVLMVFGFLFFFGQYNLTKPTGA